MTLVVNEGTVQALSAYGERTVAAAGARLKSAIPGGVFCVRQDGAGSTIHLGVCGAVPEEKFKDWERQATEKIMRLATHADHISAFSSRCGAEHRFAGAFRSRGVLYSFHGLNEDELVCEAYFLAMVVKLGWCSPLLAKRIIQKSQNANFEPMWVVVKGV